MHFGERYSEVLEISSLKHLWQGIINDEDAILFVVLTMYISKSLPKDITLDELLLSKEAIDSEYSLFKKIITFPDINSKKVIDKYIKILKLLETSSSIIRRFSTCHFNNQKTVEKEYFYMIYKVGSILEKNTQNNYFFIPYSLLSFIQNILFSNFMEKGFPNSVVINDLSPIFSSVPHFIEQQLKKYKKSIKVDILKNNVDLYSYIYSLIVSSLFKSEFSKEQHKDYDIILMLSNNFKELEKNNKTLNPKILSVIAGVSQKLKNNKSIAMFLIPVSYLSSIVIREKSSSILKDVESIILLPPKLFLNDKLPQALLIIRKDKSSDECIKVLDLDDSKYLCVNSSQAFSPKIYFKKNTLNNFTFKENEKCFLQYERIKKKSIYEYINKYKAKYPPYYREETI